MLKKMFGMLLAYLPLVYSADLYCYNEQTKEYKYISKYDNINFNKENNNYETNDYLFLRDACSLFSPNFRPVIGGSVYGHYELVNYEQVTPKRSQYINVTCSGLKVDKPYFTSLKRSINTTYIDVAPNLGEYEIKDNTIDTLLYLKQ